MKNILLSWFQKVFLSIRWYNSTHIELYCPHCHQLQKMKYLPAYIFLTWCKNKAELVTCHMATAVAFGVTILSDLFGYVMHSTNQLFDQEFLLDATENMLLKFCLFAKHLRHIVFFTLSDLNKTNLNIKLCMLIYTELFWYHIVFSKSFSK